MILVRDEARVCVCGLYTGPRPNNASPIRITRNGKVLMRPGGVGVDVPGDAGWLVSLAGFVFCIIRGNRCDDDPLSLL